MLNDKQKEICLKIWKQYKTGNHVSEPGGMTFDEWDRRRREIGPEIEAVINEYVACKISLNDFKYKIDSLNKRHNLWGFSGWKGQYFFNMMVFADDRFERNLDDLLRDVILEPKSADESISKMQVFHDAVEQVASTYDDRRKGPTPTSVPYFLTYFWSIQNQDKWRIEYPSAESAYEMLGLWSKTGDIVKDYQSFIELADEIHELFKKHSDSEVPFEEVGHVFYDYYLKQTEAISEGEPASSVTAESETETAQQPTEQGLPKSYIPPVVRILPQLARNDPKIAASCQAEGQGLPAVFEHRVGTVFELLGFDIERLGQGHGRVADIIAKSRKYHYAMVIDTKARRDAYSIGIESRKFIEYIRNESPRLRDDEGMRRVYLAIVSSAFPESRDSAINEIKHETDIHGVIMFRAEDLLRILDHSLRHPRDFDLGSSGFMALLMDDGVVTKEKIRTVFGI
jgi:hypothetical protein